MRFEFLFIKPVKFENGKLVKVNICPFDFYYNKNRISEWDVFLTVLNCQFFWYKP